MDKIWKLNIMEISVCFQILKNEFIRLHKLVKGIERGLGFKTHQSHLYKNLNYLSHQQTITKSFFFLFYTQNGRIKIGIKLELRLSNGEELSQNQVPNLIFIFSWKKIGLLHLNDVIYFNITTLHLCWWSSILKWGLYLHKKTTIIHMEENINTYSKNIH